MKASAEALRKDADSARQAHYEERCRTLGIPADLQASADAFYAIGGLEKVEEQAKAWAAAGRLVPLGRNGRTSRPADSGDLTAEDMSSAAARSLLTEIRAREGVTGTGAAMRILATENSEAHRLLGGSLVSR